MKKIGSLIIIVLLSKLGYAQNKPVMVGVALQQLESSIPTPITNTISLPSAYNAGSNAAPSNFNYVRSYEPQAPISNAGTLNESTTPYLVKMNTQYTDGFGRPLQTITRSMKSGSFRHIVIPFEYRPSATTYTYPSYSVLDNNVSQHFHNSPFSEQQAYYNVLFPNEPGMAVNESSYYSDGSGYRRVTTYAPGKGNIGQSRGSQTSFQVNNENEIVKWTLDITNNMSTPVMSGYYAAGVLTVKNTSNPDGIALHSYYDAEGKLICSVTNEFEWTYYVYDFYGRLVYTISPKAISKITLHYWVLTSDIIRELCDYNYYDEKGRVFESHQAGELGDNYFVYDQHNRLILKQTPAEAGKWSFTLYDKLNRSTVGGQIESTNRQEDWANIINNPNAPGITYITSSPYNIAYYFVNDNDDYDTYNSHSFYFYVLGQSSYSLPGYKVMSCNFYDNYKYFQNGTIPNIIPSQFTYDAASFTANGNTLSAAINSIYPVVSDNTGGLMTGQILGGTDGYGNYTSQLKTTAFFYDDHARVIQSVTKNEHNGLDISSNQYDFKGHLIMNMLLHNNPLSTKPNTTIATKYNYTSFTFWPSLVTQQIDGGTAMQLMNNQYDEFGRLTRQIIGGVENQNFTYNIRNQLAGINPQYAETGNTTGGPMTFGESLKYDFGFSSRLYGGNISGMIWRDSGNNAKAYGYTYDEDGRLIDGNYNELLGFNNGTGAYTLPYWNTVQTDFSEHNISYDPNGNIKTLDRYGLVNNGSTIGPDKIDQLNYYYGEANNDISNKLNIITDAIQTTTTDYDFKGTNYIGNATYQHDESGNIAIDANKGLSMGYDSYINQPISIVKSTTNEILLRSYDATGTKLGEIYLDGNGHTTTYDYMGSVTYKDNDLYIINNPYGYARLENGAYRYYFYVKDHLGNIRSVLNTTAEPLLQHLAYDATMEVSHAISEGLVWGGIDPTRKGNPSSTDPNDQYAAELIGSDPGKQTATSIMLKVMPGDQFSVSGLSYYDAIDYSWQKDESPNVLTSLFGALTGGVANGVPVSELPDNQRLISAAMNNPATVSAYQGMLGNAADETQPPAYLNYLVYDENMNLIPEKSNVVQIGGPAGQWNNVDGSGLVNIQRPGYLVAFTSSRAKSPVYFNNVSLQFYKGGIVDQNIYYPFGLAVNTMSTNPVDNQYLYQGKMLDKTMGLKLDDFGARQYDPQIGRFHSLDPANQHSSGYVGMGNNPTSKIDPTGMEDDWYTSSSSPGGAFWFDNSASSFTDAGGNTWNNAGETIEGSISNPGSLYDGSNFYGDQYGQVSFYLRGPEIDAYGGDGSYHSLSPEQVQAYQSFANGMEYGTISLTAALPVSYLLPGVVSGLSAAAPSLYGTAATTTTLAGALQAEESVVEEMTPQINTTTALQLYYPPNGGFLNTPTFQSLQPGTLVDRFGILSGNYLAPVNTPFGMRALPYYIDELTTPYTQFMVNKPLMMQMGQALPAFGQMGLGTQYYSPNSIQDLIDLQYLIVK